MSVGCGFKCAKATLFTLNFIFWVASLAVLVAGIWMRVSPDFLEQQGLAKLESDAISLSIGGLILIALASMGVVLGFLGCCGAAKESQCMLGVYATFLFVILFAQMIAAFWGILALTFFKDAVETNMLSNMKENLQRKYGEKDVSDMWDFTQFKASCCGATGPKDYKNSTWHSKQNKNMTVPLSCCKSDENKVDIDEQLCQHEARMLFSGNYTSENGELNQEGCYATIKDALHTYSKILIGISAGVSLMQLLCFILGLYLCCNVQGGKYSYDYQ